jgi:hypothetical protein
MEPANLRHIAGPRARSLTLAWNGDWNKDTQKGRNAACPVCGVFAVSIPPKASKVLLVCNECKAGKNRDNRLVIAAALAGIDCGSGGDKTSRGKLWPAPDEAIAGLKKAEKRVLRFAVAQTSTGAWFGISKRTIAAACRVSERDAIPFLRRLADRGLIGIQSNNWANKHQTQVRFLVDPIDLGVRLVEVTMATPEDENVALKNEPTPSENEPTMDHGSKMNPPPLKNEPTMDHRHVRIRGVQAEAA